MNRSKSLQSHPLQSLPFRIGVDVLFAITLILLMATGVQENFAHEWLGMAAFLLFVVHQVQHESWWKALFRGKYNGFRILKTLVVACLSICFLWACRFEPYIVSRSFFLVTHDLWKFLGATSSSSFFSLGLLACLCSCRTLPSEDHIAVRGIQLR